MVIDFRSVTGSTQVSSTARTTSSKPVGAVDDVKSVQQTTQAGESVQLSDVAQHMKKVTESLGTDAPVNASRVAELKQQIADGSYQVDSSRVASKMLSFEA
ncbi:flagellar biosynthesis anti-sigma factor FlgM [Pseudomonas sp. RIT-PI-S]|uniref:flagellar biosynthesis anti-sigma factor FlgM n=1 Tax=Pseudomonas sp. RIT-PI-S TaxID=3035295 RepID=UPI0021D8C121|nr:flagellar biosynthesis anti-sigma factor FlgM [Pseudomonas sp. RIT-PI-S]